MSLASIAWALTTLQNLGYRIQNSTPETVLRTPWSCVYRFSTHLGDCYLKQVPPALWVEAEVIKILQEKFSAAVPLLIASHAQEHCFLMHNAGITLREFFKQGFHSDILATAIQHHTAIQRGTALHLTLFLDRGVPDWRLINLPLLYRALITQEQLLRDDGLTAAELNQLSQLTPKLIALCEQLSRYSIPETLSHCDFHDNNVLIHPQTQCITLIDLGEVAITHPFFSLLNMLHRAQESYALTESQYHSLQHHAFEPWLDLASEEELLRIMSLIQQFWSIHHVLAEYRLLSSVDSSSFQRLRREGRLANNLRFWLKQA